ncbi:MAG: urea amidolyase associated protein UAAP2 [Opitutales bacterium]
MITESKRSLETVLHREVVPAGEFWLHEIKRGQTLRILDLEGNQAADTLFYDARDPENRYSASDTIRRQAALYLSTGTELISTQGDVLLRITADTCGRHDTLGGACSRESNTMRYAHEKEHMHACRDSFICGLQHWGPDLGKRDITCNINFFMNVPVTPDGKLTFEDGISAPGRYVELLAERDVVCLISNCPQLNNPCNAYNPTPIEAIVWEAS